MRVVYLVNGRMRTPKIGALYLLIDWLNTDARDCEIKKLPLDSSSIGSNGWLAGFTEGDGSFEVRTTAKSAQSPQRVDANVTITQSRVDSQHISEYQAIMHGGSPHGTFYLQSSSRIEDLGGLDL